MTSETTMAGAEAMPMLPADPGHPYAAAGDQPKDLVTRGELLDVSALACCAVVVDQPGSTTVLGFSHAVFLTRAVAAQIEPLGCSVEELLQLAYFAAKREHLTAGGSVDAHVIGRRFLFCRQTPDRTMFAYTYAPRRSGPPFLVIATREETMPVWLPS
jgi:hypothetical protein